MCFPPDPPGAKSEVIIPPSIASGLPLRNKQTAKSLALLQILERVQRGKASCGGPISRARKVIHLSPPMMNDLPKEEALCLCVRTVIFRSMNCSTGRCRNPSLSRKPTRRQCPQLRELTLPRCSRRHSSRAPGNGA